MKRAGYLITAIMLLASCQLLLSQDISARLQHYDDLKGTLIWDILSDRDGVIWIATEDGIVNFDGYNFKRFHRELNQPRQVWNMQTRLLHEDVNGKIWIACVNAIFVYDPETETFNEYNYSKLLDPGRDKIRNNSFYTVEFFKTITSDNSGRVFFGLNLGLSFPFDQRVIYYDPVSDELKHLPDSEGIKIRNVYLSDRDVSGNVYFVSSDGVFKVDSNLVSTILPVDITNFKVANDPITGFAISSTNDIWMTAYQELLHYNPEFHATERWTCPDLVRNRPTYGFANIVEMAFDSDSNIWFGVDRGLLQFNRSHQMFELVQHQNEFADQLPAINAVDTDNFGNVWLGTHNQGLMNGSVRPMLNSIPGKDLSALWITSICESADGRIMLSVGTDELLPIFDTKTKTLENNLSLKGQHAWNIVPAWNEGQYIVVSDSVYNLLDSRNYSLTEIKLSGLPDTIRVHETQVDKAKRLWVCTNAGSYILDSLGFRIKYIDFTKLPGSKRPGNTTTLRGNMVKNVFLSEKYGAWFITANGLYSYNINSDVLKRHGNDQNHGDVFPAPIVNAFHEDKNNIAWVGFWQGGLSRYNPETGEIRNYSVNDGLPSMSIQGILADEENDILWLSTFGGITRFSIKDEEFNNFTIRDGTHSLLFADNSFLKSSNGHFFFGGYDGVTYFNPKTLAAESTAPKLHITDFKIVNQPIEPEFNMSLRNAAKSGQQITLKHNQNSISIHYLGIQYDDPLKNQYAFTLENFSNEWYRVGNQTTAQFSSLAPGHYIFKVKAANSQGVWSDEPLAVNIRILSPWWATWWAYLVYAALIALAVWWIAAYFKNRAQKRERDHARRLLEQTKARFFTNISHELRTPITVISGMTDELDTNPNASELIKRNAKVLEGLVGQILDLRKLDAGTLKSIYIQGDVMSYLRYICETYELSASHKGVELSMHGPGSYIMDYDPEKLMRIVSNLLSNAIKFTAPGGKIEMDVFVDEDQDPEIFNLNIRDSGIGIPPDALEHIFDRYYQVDHNVNGKDKAGDLSYWLSGAGGAGIGLAIVKEYTQLIGGKVSVKSQPGEGTTFRVSLPVTRTATFADAPVQTSLPNIQKESQALPFENNLSDENLPGILIVEDNADVAGYIESCLRDNYRTVKVSNGKEGIDAALEHMPDVVISDVMMPEMDGFELCKILKTDIRTSHIPVILLTAKADTDSRLAGLSAGADAYLVKPFNKEELLVRLKSAIALRQKLRERYSNLNIDEIPNNTQMTREDAFIQRVHQAIQEHINDSDFSTGILAELCGMSERQLQLKIKALTGKTPVLLVRTLRLTKASTLLLSSELRISEVAYQVGFSDPAYFTRAFANEYGLSPTEWRKQHDNSLA